MKKNSSTLFLLFPLLTFFPLNQFVAQPHIEWQKNFGGSYDDIPWIIRQTTDGGYIVAGSSQSIDGDVTDGTGIKNIWVLKLDGGGDIQWEKYLTSSRLEEAFDLKQTFDGGYILTGSSTEGTDVQDLIVIKLDAYGETEWSEIYGSDWVDYGLSVLQLPDSTYMLSGISGSESGDVTENNGSTDYWILKLNNDGSLLWQKSYGGSGPDAATVIEPTTDGGFILTGLSFSIDGDVTGGHSHQTIDAWFVKIDSDGNLEWQNAIGGTNNEEMYDVWQTPDGSYFAAGLTNSNDGDVSDLHGMDDYWVVKLDASGSLQWQKTIGGSTNEFLNSMHPHPDGGYLLLGYTWSADGDITEHHGTTDYWLVKINNNGGIEWEQTYGGYLPDYGTTVSTTADGGIIMAGFSMSTDGDVTDPKGRLDYWVVKLSFNPVSVKDNHVNENSVHLYPNPAHSILNFESIQGFRIHEIEIVNSLGNVVLQKKISNESSVDISHLTAGVYWVQIKHGEGVFTRKLIKS